MLLKFFREGDVLGSISTLYAMFKGEEYILPEVTNKEDSIYIETQEFSYASCRNKKGLLRCKYYKMKQPNFQLKLGCFVTIV